MRWLAGADAADTLPTLDLAESTILCALAGERYEQAVVARIGAIGAPSLLSLMHTREMPGSTQGASLAAT